MSLVYIYIYSMYHAEKEVRLDGWCAGGLGQQRNDVGDCATMSERSERVESPEIGRAHV